MKTEYFDDVISFDKLYKGMKKSCCGVRWKDSVIGYEWNGLKNTLRLRNDLLNGKYRISPYTHFKIYEPKERDITATRIRDRQFQRSLCDNGLYEDITEHFIRDNVACQRGRGTDDALNRLKVQLRRYYNKHGADGWVLKCDIHHFFPETPHVVAKEAIRKYVSDKRAAEAVYQIVDSFGGEKGIALGSQVSQLIELAVLNEMDHLIKERLGIKTYIRYADDFILVHESKEYLQYCRLEIEKHLQSKGLSLNKKTSLFPLHQGIRFLNWRFVVTDSRKVLMLIDKKKISDQKRKIRKLLAKEHDGTMPRGTAYTSLQCWLANAARGNTYRIRKEMTAYYFMAERKIKMNEAYHQKKMDELARAKAIEADNTLDAVAAVFVSASEKGDIPAEKMYRHTDFYDTWEGGKNYSTNKILIDPEYRDGSYLFKVRQPHTSQSVYPPHSVPSLYERIPKADEGSHDNPIDYDASVGMALIKGLFYIEDEVLYECIRDSGVPIYNRLADLVNNYVRVSNA